MKQLLKRFYAWRAARRHIAHVRRVRKARIVYTWPRKTLPPPERHCQRNGPEAVTN